MFDFFTRLETLVDKMMKLVELGAPIAAAVAPQYAPMAQAANIVATGVDKAITDHQAAGATPENAVPTLAAIAKSVAESGLVDAATSAKIKAITDVLPAAAFTG